MRIRVFMANGNSDTWPAGSKFQIVDGGALLISDFKGNWLAAYAHAIQSGNHDANRAWVKVERVE